MINITYVVEKCPFCGSNAEQSHWELHFRCSNRECCLGQYDVCINLIEWNTRFYPTKQQPDFVVRDSIK